MKTFISEITKKQEQAVKLSNEKLLAKRQELNDIIKESEMIIATVNEELMKRVLEQGTDKKLPIADKTVYIVERPVYRNVPLTEGAKYDALKTVLDTTKLSQLLKAGKKIKGVEMTAYIMAK